MSEEIKDLQEQELEQSNLDKEVVDSVGSNEEELNEATDNQSESEMIADKELAQLKDAHLRLMAEYDNYRKRTLKEKSELIKNGGEKVLKELLPVIDDLDIALVNMDKAEDIDALREGMKLIYSKFIDYLKKQGVEAVETTEAVFDEELHEAIAAFPAPSEELKGRIIDCVKKGYKLVIR